MNNNPTDLKINRIGLLVRALRYRNFRLFFTGQLFSLVGSWMQHVALSWLIYRLTHSPLMLGLTAFMGQIPILFLTPIAGVYADRHNRHHLLLLTQSSAMTLAFILAGLVLTGAIRVWHIFVINGLAGITFAFDIPVRQAFISDMVEKKEDLGNAIALNSSIFNAARLIGPACAGVLIATVGEGICFLVNALSYLTIIVALGLMKIHLAPKIKNRKHVLQEIREGFHYAMTFRSIKSILLLLALISLMGISYQILIPVFAKDIFHGGPHVFGFLVSGSGAGALLGAVYLALRRSVVGLEKIIALTSGLFGISVILFSVSRVLWLSLLMCCLAGFGMMVQMASSNTVLQTIVDEDKRGRIMSFYAVAFMGSMPVGSLLAGLLANRIGAPNTLLIGGSCCLFFAVLFGRQLPSLQKEIHPIYREKGIIPEVAQGMQSTIRF